MCAMGLLDHEIAAVIGVCVATLRKHFERELETAALEATAAVAQSLYRQATDPVKPNTIAGIFWLKARGGWRDGGEAAGRPGKKEQAAERAADVAAGKFAPSEPPPGLRLVTGDSA